MCEANEIMVVIMCVYFYGFMFLFVFPLRPARERAEADERTLVICTESFAWWDRGVPRLKVVLFCCVGVCSS